MAGSRRHANRCCVCGGTSRALGQYLTLVNASGWWHPTCAIETAIRLRLAIEAHREAVGVPHDVYDRDAELYAALEKP